MAQPKITARRVPATEARKGLGKAFLRCIEGVLRDVDTAGCRDVLRHLKRCDYEAIAFREMPRPDTYSSASEYAGDYLAYGLLRKSINLPISVDRTAVCIQKWMEAEATCRVVNENHGRMPMEDHGPLEGRLEAILWLARRKIHDLLGRFSWDECESLFSFTGGASTRLPRRAGHPSYKFSGKPEVTRNCALLAVCAIWHSEVWRAEMQDQYGPDPTQWVKVVEGSKFATVSKTALTDRPICIEPDMNMYIQRGIGRRIGQLLRRVRIDLRDQTRNQELALIGSRTGSLVTIDLSAASDSVSTSLVQWLIPHDWYEAMALSRSECVIFPDGVKHRLEKISSMGNGYTFELESLIFWGLSAAVVEALGVADKRIGVYGDDIIVHNSAAERLLDVLKYCGFTPNKDKTFVSGPFRESCGKHYFHGADVTPFYVKEQSGTVSDLYWLANSIRKWAGVRTLTYELVVDLIRRRGKLLCVPESFGLRAGLICELDEACPSWDRSLQRWVIPYLRPFRRKHRPNGFGAYLAALSGSSDPERFMVVETGEVTWRRGVAKRSLWQ